MIRDGAPAHQRQPDCHGEAEGVKERQHADDAVVLVDPEQLCDGFDIGNDVVVREHHAFGHAGAAARKNNGCERIGCALPHGVAPG